MNNLKFDHWCRSATRLIRFRSDKEAVAHELRSHMEDHYDALIEKGLSHEEATDQVVAAMGDDNVIAPQLAAIHTPFWGYFLRVCKVAILVLLILSLIPVWNYATDLNLRDKPNQYPAFEIYKEASYGGDTGRTLLHLSFSADGNTFTVTDVAVFRETLQDGSQSDPRLFFLMRQTGSLPWSEKKGYFQSLNIPHWFFLRDDLGNEHKGYMVSEPGEGSIYIDGVQSGIFTYTHQIGIFTFPPEAKWVELCYERDGRSYCLRIPLKGVDGA